MRNSSTARAKRAMLSSAAVLALGLAAAPAFAQDNAPAKPDANQIGEVVVTA